MAVDKWESFQKRTTRMSCELENLLSSERPKKLNINLPKRRLRGDLIMVCCYLHESDSRGIFNGPKYNKI